MRDMAGGTAAEQGIGGKLSEEMDSAVDCDDLMHIGAPDQHASTLAHVGGVENGSDLIHEHLLLG